MSTTTIINETILTADGHKYTGQLTTEVGIPGLLQSGYGVMTYTNGDVYQGDWLRNKRHGNGTLKFSDGSVYEGEWLDDMRHGCGQLKFPNGYEYEGRYAKGQKNGPGVELMPPNRTVGAVAVERYVGGFRNDVRAGRGLLQLENGCTFEGVFVNGMMHGQGTMRFPNGDLFEGFFENNAMHGKGKFTCANGDVFEGEYRDGARTTGGMASADGTAFAVAFDAKGQVSKMSNATSGAQIVFDDVQPHPEIETWDRGAGIIVFKNGDVYKGSVVKGQRCGAGKLTCSTSGDVYEGEWLDDMRHGQGTMTFGHVVEAKAGRGWRYIGEWQRDVPHGSGTLWYDTEGSQFKGSFESGLRSGFGREIVNGDDFSGEFADDKRHGQGTLKLAADGTTIVGVFVDGVCNDPDATINFGTSKGGAVYKGGVVGTVPHGEGRITLPSGEVYEGEFRNGVRKGVGLLSLPNGDTFEGQFDNDMMHGFGIHTAAGEGVWEGHMVCNARHGQGMLRRGPSSISATYKKGALEQTH